MGDNPFDKIKDLAQQHGEQVEDVLDKVADFVDDKTGGKHHDKIESAQDQLMGFLGGAGGGGSDDTDDRPSKLTP